MWSAPQMCTVGHLAQLSGAQQSWVQLSGAQLSGKVGKKWDPGILDPGPFSGQIRKVEAKIRKVDTH